MFRSSAGTWPVQAELRTDVSGGVYSWGGRLRCSDVAALTARGQGGTLTLSVPREVDCAVHVTIAELADSGVLLRVTGADRAPYEEPGDVVATPGPGGWPVFQLAEETA